MIGHSNGGFMAYRMACERADVIAAIASLAGLAASLPAACAPTRPVNVLHMHGTADDVVPYASGGSGIGTIGADGSVDQWAGKNGCATARTPGADLDLDNAVVGAETRTSALQGCPASGGIDLWRMEGSSHVPRSAPASSPRSCSGSRTIADRDWPPPRVMISIGHHVVPRVPSRTNRTSPAEDVAPFVFTLMTSACPA